MVTTMNDGHTSQSRIIMRSADAIPYRANLQAHVDLTSFEVINGAPTASLKSPISVKALASGDDTVWELASVLFDDNGVGLSAMWRRLVDTATTHSISHASTLEEKAIACLAGNRVAEACKYLLEGKDFRLATLVSAIGSNEQAKKDIRQQIKDWRESNVLSDFSEPIRAIYELLSGNTCTCPGLKSAPIENRVAPFVISERFDLDWMQSFGLRLWYAASNSIADAVHSFQSDIDQDREDEPESPLWSLLKLYADRRVNYSDYDLSWQLTRALYSVGKVSFGQKAPEKLDAITLSFASRLTDGGHWVDAAFVLLHLSDPISRIKAIREHLGEHAHLIATGANEANGVLSILTEKFKIPAKWIWEAKALHARSLRKDAVSEFSYLLMAEDFAEANRTFLKRVAPAAVIQRKYDELFEHAKLLYHIRDQLPNWSTGAAVYLLFPATRNWDGPQLPDWIDELTQGLAALKAATSPDDVLEVAALADMAEELVRLGVKIHRKGGDPKLYKLAAALPLTDDRRQKYLKDLVFEGFAQVGVH
jgi:nuclear pore complex protein Nup98-Nup96